MKTKISKSCGLPVSLLKITKLSKLLVLLLILAPLFVKAGDQSFDKRSGSNDGAETLTNSKTISFAGYNWLVKNSNTPVGPGPNFFSDSTENVRVDAEGKLHMGITQRNGNWHCAEVILMGSLGYGRYVFQLATPVGLIDAQATLGLFTWDSGAPANFFREIDIEIGRWGIPFDPTNAQFVVQPYATSGNLLRYTTPDSLEFSTHSFEWTPDSIKFLSVKGNKSAPPYDSLISSYNYTGSDIQPPGNENTRINLWLFRGFPPQNGQQFEVIISNFEYFPPQPVGIDDTPEEQLPAGYSLSQNYPNPFNPETTIAFNLPKAGFTTLNIYNQIGEVVAELISDNLPANNYRRVWNAVSFPSGIYYYRLSVKSASDNSEFVKTKKMVLLK